MLHRAHGQKGKSKTRGTSGGEEIKNMIFVGYAFIQGACEPGVVPCSWYLFFDIALIEDTLQNLPSVAALYPSYRA